MANLVITLNVGGGGVDIGPATLYLLSAEGLDSEGNLRIRVLIAAPKEVTILRHDAKRRKPKQKDK